MRLLVTRPAEDGERTASKLRARGCEVMLAPLLHVETIAADLGRERWSALVMTSANAATAIERHPRRADLLGLPLFAVGKRTAEAARNAGFGKVVSADGDESALVRRIAAQPRGQAPLLYLAGEDRAGDLAGDLAAEGIAVQTAVVYRAARAKDLPPDIAAALRAGRIDGVLHYSRRSAEVYVDCAKAAAVLDAALAAFHYCLSRNVAEPLLAAGAANVRIAAQAEEPALLALIPAS